MFRKSESSDASPQRNKQPRVYVTSLKNIASSSPAKTSWLKRSSTSSSTEKPSPSRWALRNLLWPTLGISEPSSSSTNNNDEPIISDSITASCRFQKSVLMSISLDEPEVHCCKQDEANEVIRGLQKKANHQIDDGKLQDALQNLNNSLALQQKLYGKKDARAARTLNMMGEILSNMGEDYRYMAMSALEESLAIRQELEPGSEDTAVTLKNLWLLLHQSNVSISSAEKEETTTFHDFETITRITE